MKINTAQNEMKNAISSQIQFNSEWSDASYPWGKEALRGELVKSLQALDPETCTLSELTDAIDMRGHFGTDKEWLDPRCDICQESVESWVELSPKNYEEEEVCICLSCLRKAASMLEELT